MQPAGVRFGVLGPLQAWRAGKELDLGPPQQRLILAVLMARPGDVVSVAELVDVLWDSDAPASAMNVIHRHIGLLRRLLEPDLPPRATGRWLVRQGAGYRLKVDAESVDILAFRDLVLQARDLPDEQAVSMYRKAFELWRGPCADGLASGPRAGSIFTAVDNECAAAADEMARVALRCGLAADVLPVLRAITPHEPLNEWLHARLMLVLAVTGHQAEALGVYRAVTARLSDELGIDPGVELRSAHAQVLRQEHQEQQPVQPVVARPAQLPMDLPNFGGRRAELNKMRESLSRAEMPMTIAAIDGMPGAGKTTVAVHLAHSLVDQYPDGQLYVNLRGFDPSGLVIEPSTALVGFLTALGVGGDRIPADTAAQAALYRTCLAGKRVVVVLDNARDAEQVLPLLPGAPTCLVIVTSRNRLVGLVALEGADPFTLDPVPVDEAREILALRVGRKRASKYQEAVDTIVEICHGLPLALAIVAARAATYPDLPLTAIAEELSAAPDSLDPLSHDEERGVRAVFSWSYQALKPYAARLFRLLGSHWGPDVSAPACAALLGVPVREARAAIAELSRTRLVSEHVPGRFMVHDLVRAYAMELSAELDTPAARDQAVIRVLSYYLHSAHAANQYFAPHQPLVPDELPPGVTPEQPADAEGAFHWMGAEYRVVLTAVRQAIELGHVELGWQLAVMLQNYQHISGLLQDWATVMRTALAAARQAGDLRGQVRTERSLAGAYSMMDDSQKAYEHLLNTQALIEKLGWTEERAYVERSLADVLRTGGTLPVDLDAAITHYERAAELYREMDHKQGQAYAMEGIANCLLDLNRPEPALPLVHDALALHREIGDINGEGYGLLLRAGAYLQLDRVDEAAACLERAIELHVDGRHRLMQIDDLTLLGEVRMAQDNPRAARSAWLRALALTEQVTVVAATVADIQAKLDSLPAGQA